MAPQLCWPTGIGKIRLADDLDTVPREEIERLQAGNLAAMVAAAAGTPAVRRRFPAVPHVAGAGDLTRLPLLSPAELAAGCPPHSDALLLGGAGPGLVLRSSGTSGRRKVLYHSWQFTRQVSLLGVRGVRRVLADRLRAGHPPADRPHRMANCLHAGELAGSFTFAQDIGQLLPALTFPFGHGLSIAETAEVLAEHEVDTLLAGPAFAVDLLTRYGCPPALRTLLYIGEPLSGQRRQAIAAVAPELTVRSLAYSASETGPIGYQCPHVDQDTHHLHEDAVVVELVDEHTGQPVPVGQVGEVVVTPLTDTGMALFRYRTGDRGRLRAEPCPCGSAAALVTLHGRVDQSITVISTTISSDLVMARLAVLGVTDPADCQFQVCWAGASFQARLLLSPRTPGGLSAEAVTRSLCQSWHLNYLLTNTRCAGFTVERVDPARFARNARGKVPFFYERHDGGDDGAGR